MDGTDRSYLHRLTENLKTARAQFPDLNGQVVIRKEQKQPAKSSCYFVISRDPDFWGDAGPFWYFFYSTKNLVGKRKWLAIQPNPSEEWLEAKREEMEASQLRHDTWMRFQQEADQGGQFLVRKKIGWVDVGSHNLVMRTPLFHRWCVSMVEWAAGLPADSAEHLAKQPGRDAGEHLIIGNYWDTSLAYAEWLLSAPQYEDDGETNGDDATSRPRTGRKKPKTPRSQNVKDIIRLAAEGLDNNAITGRLPGVGAVQVRQVRCDYAQEIAGAAKAKKPAGARKR